MDVVVFIEKKKQKKNRKKFVWINYCYKFHLFLTYLLTHTKLAYFDQVTF